MEECGTSALSVVLLQIILLVCQGIEWLKGSDMTLPYVFVADDAFPLRRHIMKPFSHSNYSRREGIFSYSLSRARRTVENSFGILANRFRVFLLPVDLPPSNIETIVLACTSLHNFLRRDHVSHYTPEGCWRSVNRTLFLANGDKLLNYQDYRGWAGMTWPMLGMSVNIIWSTSMVKAQCHGRIDR